MDGAKSKRAWRRSVFSLSAAVRFAGYVVAGLLCFYLSSIVIASVAIRAKHEYRNIFYDPDLAVIWNENQRFGYTRAHLATPDDSLILLQPNPRHVDAEDGESVDSGTIYLGRERVSYPGGYSAITIGRLSERARNLGGYLKCFTDRGEEPRILMTYDIGFPMRAVSLARAYPVIPNPFANRPPQAPLIGYSVGGQFAGVEVVIPYKIDWPVLIVNAVAWGGALRVIWFGADSGRRAVRAVVRSKRSRCVTCGYDLAGFTGSCCPECGRLITRKSDPRKR